MSDYIDRQAALDAIQAEREYMTRTEQWLVNQKHGLNKAQGKSVVGTSMKDGAEIAFEALNDCASMGFMPSCVSLCCNGKARQHKGYKWRFADNGI